MENINCKHGDLGNNTLFILYYKNIFYDCAIKKNDTGAKKAGGPEPDKLTKKSD